VTKPLRIVLCGFGNVGREVYRLLCDESPRLERLGFSPVVVGIITRSRGHVYVPTGITSEHLQMLAPKDSAAVCTTRLIEQMSADVVVEMTPLDVFSAKDVMSHARAALTSGKHVVCANKGAIAWGYDELSALASAKARLFLFECCVMDGAPIFAMVRNCLPAARILKFEGVLNSTSNYVLDKMLEGVSMEEAITMAKRAGFAESDPRLDIDGWDSAAKIAALANVFMHARINPLEVVRQGITQITCEQVQAAARGAMRIRLVASAVQRQRDVLCEVKPCRVAHSSLFGSVNHTSSVLSITTDLMGNISIVEHDPGLLQTAYGVLRDIIEVASFNK